MLRALSLYRRTVGLVGLAKALRSRIAHAVELVPVAPAELVHPLWLRVPSSDVYTYEQVFDEREYEFNVTRDPRVIVDAGANIGLATVLFAHRFPNARIIAIEPERSNFEILKMNVARYANVTTVQGALWSRNEEIELVDPGLGNWGFMTRDPEGQGIDRSLHKVPAFTVDRLMEMHGIDRIDVLKIDIEGAEREVFQDASNWIDRVNALIVELHDRMKAGCSRSFYRATDGFALEWNRGENVYLARPDSIAPAQNPAVHE